jgi:hypothetical protein
MTSSIVSYGFQHLHPIFPSRSGEKLWQLKLYTMQAAAQQFKALAASGLCWYLASPCTPAGLSPVFSASINWRACKARAFNNKGKSIASV